MTIHDLDTPALICDLDITERNLRAMQAACDAGGTSLRPHIKTHKVPEIGRWQLDLGAQGLTVAKLGEAEAMLDGAGCDDLFIAYSLVGAQKVARSRSCSTAPRYGSRWSAKPRRGCSPTNSTAPRSRSV